MFGISIATELLRDSSQITWNCVSNLVNIIWNKFNHITSNRMPRSRKRHHSRSRSRSHSPDRTHDKHRKIDSHEKDGKRRKIDTFDSPLKKSLSEEPDHIEHQTEHDQDVSKLNIENKKTDLLGKSETDSNDCIELSDSDMSTTEINKCSDTVPEPSSPMLTPRTSVAENCDTNTPSSKRSKLDETNDNTTPKRTPKQNKLKMESEKKRLQKLKEKEDKEKKKQDERDRLREEKLKQKQQKDAEKQKEKEMKEEQKRKEREEKEELKRKEKEEKEEQKRKEREEKEQKRKEREEKEEQKRKERELEKIKKQEIDEKKQREEEKKQKTAAAFINFFLPKKNDNPQEERKVQAYFMPFEVKSDMKLAPTRRKSLTCDEKERLTNLIENQDMNVSYLKDLKVGSITVGKDYKTWPYKEEEKYDDVTIIEEDSNLCEAISEDEPKRTRIRAKYLHFHENRRPAYFGTWRKKSLNVKPKRPFAEDTDTFNYDEDSDDDWEEEEQGESLDVSDDENDKDTEDDKDDYEVDNDFFVPHGHLSDDEVDDEENARLSPESLKQKLKLLKDEFEENLKSKTHKLKPRSIGCVWYTKSGDNVEEAIDKYLRPFAIICNGPIEVKRRSFINSNANSSTSSSNPKKYKPFQDLEANIVCAFLKLIHGNVSNQKIIAEEFLTYLGNNNQTTDISKNDIVRNLKQMAKYCKYMENGKNKFCWFVNKDVLDLYKLELETPPNANSAN